MAAIKRKSPTGWAAWWAHVKNQPQGLERVVLTGLVAFLGLFSAGHYRLPGGWYAMEAMLLSVLVVASIALFWCIRWFRWNAATGIVLGMAGILWLILDVLANQKPPLELWHLVLAGGAALLLVQVAKPRSRTTRSVQLGASWTRE